MSRLPKQLPTKTGEAQFPTRRCAPSGCGSHSPPCLAGLSGQGGRSSPRSDGSPGPGCPPPRFPTGFHSEIAVSGRWSRQADPVPRGGFRCLYSSAPAEPAVARAHGLTEGHPIVHYQSVGRWSHGTCGCSSVVEHLLAKERVESSNLFIRLLKLRLHLAINGKISILLRAN